MSHDPSAPESQSFYQVSFDWGQPGVDAVSGGADVVVWVDQIAGQAAPAVAGVPVVAGSVQNAAAVADWVVARQAERGDRFVVAVVAAGEPRADGSLRFAVEDLLGAGAVIEALTAVGIDHCSPEAAAASAAYFGLRRATKHLIGASVSGRGTPGFQLDPTPSAEVPRLD